MCSIPGVTSQMCADRVDMLTMSSAVIIMMEVEVEMVEAAEEDAGVNGV